ncbi:P-loop containing nucleoside triphosphate hydrolase protein [Trichoderma sp. SZMC 28013]
MESIYSFLTTRALRLKKGHDDQNRVIVALAGPPGSGKSTIAAEVVSRLNTSCSLPIAAVLPMDGFHLSRATLDTMPNSTEAYARRGAPWTFDAAGVVSLVEELSESRFGAHKKTIIAPSFDHATKDPVEGGITLGQEIRFVLLEGNYLLLDAEPWKKIRELVDETWFVDVDPALATDRIAKRHIQSGIELNWNGAMKRARDNDLLNGVQIRDKLLAPDIKIESIHSEQ